jgi:hypothetical protein
MLEPSEPFGDEKNWIECSKNKWRNVDED